MTFPRAGRRPKSNKSRTSPATGQARLAVSAVSTPTAHARGDGSITRRDRFTTAALFVAVFAIYFATSSAHLAGGDNAEFVTIFARGGVAHPSGYPLYCILLRLCAWMPGGAVMGSSRVSAIIGALSVAALYRACRAWGASPTASLVATALYAFSPLAWRLATQAEVFALNALFASLLLYVAAPGVTMTPVGRVVVLAGLAGLAVSNHETIVLLAPIGLLATIRALLASHSRVRVAALAIVCFGAGLLPYLYCYEVGRAPDGRYVWGEPGTWSGLLHHVLRADFGTLRLTAADPSPQALSNVGLYLAQTANHTLVVPVVIGLFGFVRMHVRAAGAGTETPASPLPNRRDVLSLFATWALAGPVFAAFLNVSPDALGATVVERFRLLPEVVLTIAVAWGLDAWRALRESRPLPLALAAIAAIGPGFLHSWPQVRAEHANALELYTENTETSAPPGAVILGTGDYRLFSFLYGGMTGLRPDVTYIDPHLLGYDWYRARAGRALGAPISAGAQPSVDAIALVEQAFLLGRPVLLTDIFDPQIVRTFSSYPLGTLIVLLPRGASLPAPESVEQENLGVFAGFRRWTVVAPEDEWQRAVLPTYQRPWIALARMFERRGDEARARVNRERGEVWGSP
jgi:hypothetical protein